MTTEVPPKIIQDVGFDFHWSERKVWQLHIDTEEMCISELEWMFDIPFWNSPGGHYDLSPNQVLINPKKHNEEYLRVLEADLKYPIEKQT